MILVKLIDRFMAVIVLGTAVLAFLVPSTFNWIPSASINYLLGVVMLLMGMTAKMEDFKVVFTRPRDIITGTLAQFIIMPIIAWILTRVFGLPDEYAIGVILVGCCPGGTASNVITYLSRGDLALSVGMTSVSTLLAPIVTPLLCFFYAGTAVDVNVTGMLMSIVKIVILPIAAGFAVQKYLPDFTAKAVKILPAFSTFVIALIVGIVISLNSAPLHETGYLIILVVMLHNMSGLALGFITGKLMKMPFSKCVALSIEVGMQNSGLACSLAQQHFSALQAATVPGAVFSVWHNISGALMARLFRVLQKKSTSTAEPHGATE